MAHAYGPLILLLGLSTCGCGGRATFEVEDISALVQGSLQRRQVEVAEDVVLDFDGCPAERSYVEALHAQELPSLRRAEALTEGCIESGGDAGHVGCGLEERRRREGGEPPKKEIYFMRHAQPSCCPDCGLDHNGREQVEGLKANNTLLVEGALSSDPNKQAQVVYMSPTTRTMETALRLFGHLDIPMVVDVNLVESFGYKPSSSCTECVHNMLQDLHRMDIMPQYSSRLQEAGVKWTNAVNADPHVRISKFVHQLLKGKEDRVVVVSHHLLLESFRLGMECMNMGETVVKFKLSEDGWFKDSPLSCANRRRRLPYGNFQQQLTPSEDDGLELNVELGDT